MAVQPTGEFEGSKALGGRAESTNAVKADGTLSHAVTTAGIAGNTTVADTVLAQDAHRSKPRDSLFTHGCCGDRQIMS